MKTRHHDSEPSTLGGIFTYGIIACIILAVAISLIWQTIQFYRTTYALKTLSIQTLRELRVYPRTTLARGIPVLFSSFDPGYKEFIIAVTDIRAYRGSPSKIDSFDHEWFVEVETSKGDIIQMRCHIPANTKNVVHGELGQFYEKGGGPYYGKFQSHGLFQWYQQYKYLWLYETGDDGEISIQPSQ